MKAKHMGVSIIAGILAFGSMLTTPILTGAQTVSDNTMEMNREQITEETDISADTGVNKQVLSGVTYQSNVPVWDCVYFGSYWQEDTNQDGIADSFDEKTKIKWRVLSIDGNDALLISDKVLDMFWYKNDLIDYDYTKEVLSWEQSALKKHSLWRFQNSAFTYMENQAIIKNQNASSYIYVDVPSRTDITKASYGFALEENRIAYNTAYAADRNYYNGKNNSAKGVTVPYWLQDTYAANTANALAITESGAMAYYDKETGYIGVRPMIHLDISYTDDWQYAGTVAGDGTIMEASEFCYITKDNAAEIKPVTTLAAGKTYYFRMLCDMEMAHGATLIFNITPPGGTTYTYTAPESYYYEQSGNMTIYAPMVFSEIGDYQYDISIKYADGSIRSYANMAKHFTVYKDRTKKTEAINESVSFQYDSATKTMKVSGSGAVKTDATRSAMWLHQMDIENLEVGEGITGFWLQDFNEAVFLKKVTFPSTLKTIGIVSFQGSGVEEVSFKEGLEKISESTFRNCRNLKEITLPKTVMEIESSAFANCSSLSSITLKGAKEIHSGAFNGTAIEKIVLPENLESICAVTGTTTLDTTYMDTPFNNCQKLMSIEVSSNNKYYQSKEGVLFSKDGKMLVLCPQTKSGKYVVPEGVEKLGWNAFTGCRLLTEITLPNTLKTATITTFEETSAKELVFPLNVSNISYGMYTSTDYATYSYLRSINKLTINPYTKINIHKVEVNPTYEIPDLSGVKIYGYTNTDAQTFAREWGMTFVSQGICHKLTFDASNETRMIAEGKPYDTFYSLPTPVKDGYAFQGWYTAQTGGEKIENTSIVKVTADQLLYAHWKKKPEEKGKVITDKKSSGKYKVTSSDTDAPTVQYVGVSNKKKKTVTIPQYVNYEGVKYKVTSVAAKTFRNNKKLTSVSIATSVTQIGAEAFSGCTNLKTVTIGKSLKTIGNNAFKNCKKLTKITIKSTKLKTVGKNALKGIHKNCKIKVPKAKLSKYKKLFKNKGQKKSVKVTK